MPWHVYVASLSADGLRLKVKGGFTGYALRTGEICRVMSQMKTRLKGSVVLRLLWPIILVLWQLGDVRRNPPSIVA